MIKKITFLILLVSYTLQAQTIPTGYYDHASGFTGYTLKTKLKEIIDNVDDATITVNEYIATDEGYAALWTAYQNVNSGDKDLYAARIWFLIGSACFSPELLSCKMFLLSRGVLFN